ncbi:TetR family transcriptional regulator [Streptomyces zingiberis]|uniref:TetR family transcriptional regulator n=1 Tax=Streptomyces zingiberis TaxID=2053010 RepID=A0ABX1BRT2_9ACTN|nr:TetR family transcriptional regulator [Streptomyces zingiberis]NJQ00449.1 TetR family transcriptional regulator [Streptomyces zingiberis]
MAVSESENSAVRAPAHTPAHAAAPLAQPTAPFAVKQQRALRTRQALISSAAHAFEEHGYTRASLADISAGAGVSRGALGHHFQDKAAVAATVEAVAAGRLREIATAARRSDANPLRKLASASLAVVEQLRRDVVIRAGLRLAGDPSFASRTDLYQEWERCVAGLLAEAADAGLLTGDPALRRVALATITAASRGFVTLGHEDPDWLDPQLHVHFWDLMLTGLTIPRPPSVPRSRAAAGPSGR